MITIENITFRPNGDIELYSDTGRQYSFPRKQFEIDQAFNPNLPSMALAIAVAELIDTVANLQNQIDELKQRSHYHA